MMGASRNVNDLKLWLIMSGNCDDDDFNRDDNDLKSKW